MASKLSMTFAHAREKPIKISSRTTPSKLHPKSKPTWSQLLSISLSPGLATPLVVLAGFAVALPSAAAVGAAGGAAALQFLRETSASCNHTSA